MSPVRGATVAAGGMLERADGVLRRWPVAGLSLLTLVIVFIAATLVMKLKNKTQSFETWSLN